MLRCQAVLCRSVSRPVVRRPFAIKPVLKSRKPRDRLAFLDTFALRQRDRSHLAAALLTGVLMVVASVALFEKEASSSLGDGWWYLGKSRRVERLALRVVKSNGKLRELLGVPIHLAAFRGRDEVVFERAGGGRIVVKRERPTTYVDVDGRTRVRLTVELGGVKREAVAFIECRQTSFVTTDDAGSVLFKPFEIVHLVVYTSGISEARIVVVENGHHVL